MTTVINGTTGTSIAGDATIQGNLTVTGTLFGGVPTGVVFWFAANAAPTGYLEASGAAVSRTTYAALFTVVGTTFGSGDGSTTFNLPDLRGEFIRGWDNGRGVDPARVFGSAQADEFESHTHTWQRTVVGGAFAGQDTAGNYSTSATNTSAAGGTETRPRNIALLPCIKT
jgi:phage-related tail fiber protein